MNNKWECHFLRKTKRAKNFHLWLVQARVIIGTCSLTGEFFSQWGSTWSQRIILLSFLDFGVIMRLMSETLMEHFAGKDMQIDHITVGKFQGKGWVSEKFHPSGTVSAAAAAKLLQSCPTLCDPIDGSPPGSPIPGIFQARILEWVAISFSNASKWKVKVESLSRVRLFAIPWTAAYQATPSMGFSRQEYWSGVPLPSPRNCL